MMRTMVCAVVFSLALASCSAKKGTVDVNSFESPCLKDCAMGFNGCMSLAKAPDAEKLCDTFFSKCKNECAAKDKPAVPAPAPAAEPVPAPAAAPAAEPVAEPAK